MCQKKNYVPIETVLSVIEEMKKDPRVDMIVLQQGGLIVAFPARTMDVEYEDGSQYGHMLHTATPVHSVVATFYIGQVLRFELYNNRFTVHLDTPHNCNAHCQCKCMEAETEANNG